MVLVTIKATVAVEGAFDRAKLEADLAQFGEVDKLVVTELAIRKAPSSHMKKEVCVLLSNDFDDAPHLFVDQPGSKTGYAVSDKDWRALLCHAICRKVYVETGDPEPFLPHEDAVNKVVKGKELLELVAAKAGFALERKGFRAEMSVRWDAGSTDVWLVLGVPDSVKLEEC